MNQLDVYYKALLEYRKITQSDKSCERQCKEIAELCRENDIIAVSYNICNIDEEWVNEIEKGLIYIEKAIKEERQFIYSNGEVIPIEKIKNVSKESVTHLARHSNYITREVDSKDIVPDKLYSVERLNDYAVYENRFLYMLLCYLRDFVTLRYNKIIEIVNKYQGSLTVKKQLDTSTQKLSVEIRLNEEHLDDDYLKEHNSAKAIIDRIDLILKTILAFLSTPLMEYASKAAMLKPPITKTNVLKMDNNFKGAVALYDYIISYDGEGFTQEKKMVELSPLRQNVAEEISEAIILLSFLTYEYGLDLNGALKISHEYEESLRREEELKKRADQLEALKRRINKSGGSIDEYTLELEKHNRAMQFELAKSEGLYTEIAGLKERNASQIAEIANKQKEIDLLIIRSAEQEQKYTESIMELESEHLQKVNEIIAEGEIEKKNIESEWREELQKVRDHYTEMDSHMRERIIDIDNQMSALNEQMKALEAEKKLIIEEKTLAKAQLIALRAKNNDITDDDDYTEKESFNELEKEFESFKKFYEAQWSKTKKKIRKNSLTWKNFRKDDD